MPGFQRPNHGYLGGWADQGVLLLNAVLTVREGRGRANSHADKGWEQLTDAVIQWISENCAGVVFMLWGGKAQEKRYLVDERKLLEAAHPSPNPHLNRYGGWFETRHFSKCNTLLKEAGGEPVDWGYLPPPPQEDKETDAITKYLEALCMSDPGAVANDGVHGANVNDPKDEGLEQLW